jgi:predicted neuraminidase
MSESTKPENPFKTASQAIISQFVQSAVTLGSSEGWSPFPGVRTFRTGEDSEEGRKEEGQGVLPRSARWIFVVFAWLLCAAAIFTQGNPFADPKFASNRQDSAAGVKATPFFKEEFINPGQHLPMVHVASLAKTENGLRAAVWYGGSGECAPDVSIYFSASPRPLGAWSQPRAVMTRLRAERDLGRPVKSIGNAVLLANPDGSLRLLFVTIAMGRWSASQLNTCISRDGGATWSPSERLTLSPLFNFSDLVRNLPISLAGGGWCVPVYQEFLGKFPELLWMQESGGGLIVRKSRIAGGCSTLQPSLIPLDDKRAVALLRDVSDARRIFMSHSSDGGLNWSKPAPTNLPNPDAGIAGISLLDGEMLLAYNDSSHTRDNLSLAVSKDGGRFWEKIAVLESQRRASFSYPFLGSSSNGLIRIAYTYKRLAIKMVSINSSWIAQQEARKNKL